MDPAPNSKRTLIRFSVAGVVLSAIATAATFASRASEFTILRYPLLAAAMFTVVLAGWSTGRLPAFNRTLWVHAPWWARLSWLAIIAAALAVFATISLTETLPASSDAEEVLETRGISAVATYLFLIAGLRGNVDESLAGDKPFEYPASAEDEQEPTSKRRSRKATG